MPPLFSVRLWLGLGFFIYQNSFEEEEEEEEHVFSEREADAESGSAEHESAESHGAPANRPLRRRDTHHRTPRHLLRIQHRPQSMGIFQFQFSLCFDFSQLFLIWVFVLISLTESQGRRGTAVCRKKVNLLYIYVTIIFIFLSFVMGPIWENFRDFGLNS